MPTGGFLRLLFLVDFGGVDCRRNVVNGLFTCKNVLVNSFIVFHNSCPIGEPRGEVQPVPPQAPFG